MRVGAALSGVRLITFDAFGTLIRPRAPIGETYAKLAKENGVAIDAERVRLTGRFILEMTSLQTYSSFRRFFTAFDIASPCFGHRPGVPNVETSQQWWQNVVTATIVDVTEKRYVVNSGDKIHECISSTHAQA